MFRIWPELSFFNYVAKNSQLSGGKDTLAIIVSDLTSRSHILKRFQIFVMLFLIFSTYDHVVIVPCSFSSAMISVMIF